MKNTIDLLKELTTCENPIIELFDSNKYHYSESEGVEAILYFAELLNHRLDTGDSKNEAIKAIQLKRAEKAKAQKDRVIASGAHNSQ